MSRLAATFERLAAARRKALIPYVTAGFPTPAQTVPVMHALVAGGADAIELGVPFSDPMADGPVIQRANEHALAYAAKLAPTLPADRIILVNLSGRGDKDADYVAKVLGL